MVVSSGSASLLTNSDGSRIAPLPGGYIAPTAVIDGTDGNDILHGTEQSDTIDGRAGQDILYGNGGDDDLLGGGGSDYLDGGDGNDYLNTDFDDNWWDDSLNGGAGDDILNAGYGNDTLHGDDGDDVLIGGHPRPSQNSISGDADGDKLYGDSGNDILIGSGMSDQLYGGTGNDVLMGGEEQDILYSDEGADFLDGGAGYDYVDYRSSNAAVTVNLSTGAGQGGHAEGDYIRNIEVVRGSAFDDTLIGDDDGNDLFGFAGNDTLIGGAGIDHLIGSEGNDTMFGGGGDDLFEGRQGADQIDGGDGQDIMSLYSFENIPGGVTVDLAAGTASGGAVDPGDTFRNIEGINATPFDDKLYGDGNDNIFTGHEGADYMDGKGGSDTVVYNGVWRGGDGSGYGVGVTVDLAKSVAYGADADGDKIFSFENVEGSPYRDSLIGSDGDNYLTGGGGQDAISAGGGNDVLVDSDGGDSLHGGSGTDLFVFKYADSGLVRDFTVSDGDKIDLSNFYGPYEFGNEAPQDLEFIGYGKFTGEPGQLNLVQDGASTFVNIDLDGDQVADAQITLGGVTEPVTADAFLL